jgi:threonine 3-dehydrogenase
MERAVVLVTGAGGEMGHLLLPALSDLGHAVVALDRVALPTALVDRCRASVEADILDTETLGKVLRRHRPAWVFHLAAVLSTRAEDDPALAHAVNVQGTVGLMDLCLRELVTDGREVRFMFPSSIAVYGLPDGRAKRAAGAVTESQWNFPSGSYGCTKLYCELLGSYYTRRARSRRKPGIDFRAIRFPGLISSETVPTGGTSDYAPEMIHAAAQGRPYACFVRPDTRLPFMTMVDAVEAFVRLARAPAESLSARVYNVRAFSPSAEEIRQRVATLFPDASITFAPDARRQAIVDSWPADVDDGHARADWGFAPRHDLDEALRDYLLPALRARYGARPSPAVNPDYA